MKHLTERLRGLYQVSKRTGRYSQKLSEERNVLHQGEESNGFHLA
jgi:hypothetical protein